MTISLPRPLDPFEVIELSKWYACAGGHSYDEIADGVCTPAQAFLIPDYMTDSPGYCGELVFAVWPGSPEFVDVFTVDRSQICRVCGREKHDFHTISTEDELCDWYGENPERHRFEETFRPWAARLTRILSGAEYAARLGSISAAALEVAEFLEDVRPQLGPTSRGEAEARIKAAREAIERG